MTNPGFFLLSSPENARIGLILFFSDLRGLHNESTHTVILESLEWPETQAIFCLACYAAGEIGGDFEAFAAEIKRQAALARQRGLVRPAGAQRASGGGRKKKGGCNG